MRIGIVIPVYNEEPTLAEMFRRLEDAGDPRVPTGGYAERFFVLVDDGSTDTSKEIIRTLATNERVAAVYHKHNMGKGAAVASGFRTALQHGADAVLIHDADLEYDPCDHADVLAPILDGRADAVIGSRFIGRTHRVLYFWHYAANRLLTLISNVLTNLNLSDIECCSKAFTREVAQRLDIKERAFGVEPELVARCARMKIPDGDAQRPLRIFEVAVSYSGRTYAEGKKITWRDGLSAIRCILTYSLFR
ncbi:MAG: glycosyltransferase family 2 protein [Planctomycetota bacterium]